MKPPNIILLFSINRIKFSKVTGLTKVQTIRGQQPHLCWHQQARERWKGGLVEHHHFEGRVL